MVFITLSCRDSNPTDAPRFRKMDLFLSTCRLLDSGAVPLTEHEPGKTPFCVVFPAVLDQLDFGVQVGAVRLGEQPEGLLSPSQVDVLLLLAGDSGAGCAVGEADDVRGAGHVVYLLLDMGAVRQSWICAASRPERLPSRFQSSSASVLSRPALAICAARLPILPR